MHTSSMLIDHEYHFLEQYIAVLQWLIIWIECVTMHAQQLSTGGVCVCCYNVDSKVTAQVRHTNICMTMLPRKLFSSGLKLLLNHNNRMMHLRSYAPFSSRDSVRRLRRSVPHWKWSLSADPWGLWKEDWCRWRQGLQNRNRQEWYMRLLARIAKRCMCMRVKPRGHWKSGWVSTDKQWDEETPRMASQLLSRRPTIVSNGKVPHSKEEPKGSGRGEQWKPSRSREPPRTWTWPVASYSPWCGTPSWTLPHTHPT